MNLTVAFMLATMHDHIYTVFTNASAPVRHIRSFRSFQKEITNSKKGEMVEKNFGESMLEKDIRSSELPSTMSCSYRHV